MTAKRLTGQGTFADDHRPAGLLHVAVVRSPHPNARVVSVDSSAARGLPGVVLVIAPDDASKDILGGHPRFLGARVAVVAAEDPELALRAAESLRVEYEPMAAPLTPAEALAPEAPSVRGASSNLAAEVRREEGAVDGAFGEAERVFEGTYEVARARLGPLEPHVAHTWLDEDQRLLVRSSTEAPHRVRVRLAERLRIPAARIRVETRMVGGGFGAKSDLRGEDLCALVTLRTGRPARLALTRAEELAFAPALPAETVRLRSAVRGGAVTAVEIDLVLDAGVAPFPEERLQSGVADVLAVYGLRAFRFHGRAVHTHNPPSAAAAAAGRGLFFALESHLDEIASALKADPLDFRLAQRGRGAAAPASDPETATLEAVLAAGAREIAWSRRWKAAAAPATKRRGLGLAVARRGGAPGPRATAQLQLGEDGSFSLRLGPSASAVGAETVLTQIAAEALGATPDEVVLAGDTDFSPPEAERGTPALATTAAAVGDAARELRAAITSVGARLLGAAETGLITHQSTIAVPGGRSIRFAEVGSESLRTGPPLLATASRDPAELPPATAAFFVEVETDGETGQMRVLRIVAAMGCGPVAEAGLVEARVRGETLRALGHILAGALPDPCPTAIDEPEVVVLFVPSEGPTTPFGATHTAELATRALAAAVANAVAQAGPRLRELPLTPVAFLDRVEVASPQ